MNFRLLENQSESLKSPGNLFLKKVTNPDYLGNKAYMEINSLNVHPPLQTFQGGTEISC